MKLNQILKSKGDESKRVLVSSGVKLVGDMHARKGGIIAGCLKGNTKSGHKLIFAAGCQVEGDVRVESAEITGTLKGNLEALNEVMFLSGSVFEGDCRAGAIEIAEGANLELGRLEIVPPVSVSRWMQQAKTGFMKHGAGNRKKNLP